MEAFVSIGTSILIIAVIFAGIYFKKNKKIKDALEVIDEISDLANKITPLIPEGKLSKGTLKILDVIKIANSAADPNLTIEQKRDLVAKSTKKVLKDVGHPQALDDAAIEKAIKKIIK